MRQFSILLSVAASISALGQTIQIVKPVALDGQNTGTWTVIVSNPGSAPTTSRDVRLDFTPFFPVDGQVVAVPPGCHAGNARQTACEPIVLAPGESRAYEYRFRLDAPYGEVFTFATFGRDLGTTTTAVFARPFPVTTTADGGPGSLRQAIVDINQNCAWPSPPCGAVFRIDGPLPAEGWFTIRPLSPLPLVTAGHFVLDGRTQTLHTGDTNPAGPEIMLDGSATWGHGLQLDGVEATISDVAIGNFPGNGIASAATFETRIERCHLGMDPGGVTAAPNGLRGVQIERGSMNVTDNLLGGNARSGGWFEVREDARIARNRFTGNGASGFYFKLIPASYNIIEVYDNVIAGNAHAGISLDRIANGNFAHNHFGGNLGRAIDIGIDGPTLAMVPGLPGAGGTIGAPVITSVRVENGETIIEARIAPHSPLNTYLRDTVYFYVNSDRKDGGELLGSVNSASTEGDTFTLRVPGDLRGRWVSAATFGEYIRGWDEVVSGTSEICEPRLVE